MTAKKQPAGLKTGRFIEFQFESPIKSTTYKK